MKPSFEGRPDGSPLRVASQALDEAREGAARNDTHMHRLARSLFGHNHQSDTAINPQ
jgi:hypothetical protein